jgi:uncharacterized membrane protein
MEPLKSILQPVKKGLDVLTKGIKDLQKMLDSLEKSLGDEKSTKKTKAKEKPAKRARGKKTAAGKRRPKATATSEVLAVIKGNGRGVTAAQIREKTGFSDTKIRGIVFRLKKQNKIRSKGRGVYVKR